MQGNGATHLRAAWRITQLIVLLMVWFLVIWWTEGVLPEWIRMPLTVLWVLAVFGGLGMGVEKLVERRRGRRLSSNP
ncbi:hypothetical protein [Isoptericola sp. QY 916]|uniref:hypothetical protein n=1 Tax=Isoptericola sp. QY 916 TaxID=2782570 RepID=UPI003D2FE39F|nr:hypothetical protein [Isoptericola sp. QY 916]